MVGLGGSAGRIWKDEKKENLPDKILRSNDTGGDSVAEGVELDCLVRLEILLSEENVEIGVLLD